MITVHRAKERQHDRRGVRETWLAFQRPATGDSARYGFRSLENLRECRLPPGATLPRQASRDTETITYVREGSLTFQDSAGCSRVLCAGEFLCARLGRGFRRGEANASRTAWAHTFQVSLEQPRGERRLAQEQKRFSAAERRGRFCVVASPDARKGSLRITQDVLVHSALLDPGQHLVHELSPGRSAWVHVVVGSAVLAGVVLATGDCAGVVDDYAVSMTAQEGSEILLLDLG